MRIDKLKKELLKTMPVPPAFIANIKENFGLVEEDAI